LVTSKVFLFKFFMRNISKVINTKIIWMITRSIELLDELKILMENFESFLLFFFTLILSLEFNLESFKGIENVMRNLDLRNEFHGGLLIKVGLRIKTDALSLDGLAGGTSWAVTSGHSFTDEDAVFVSRRLIFDDAFTWGGVSIWGVGWALVLDDEAGAFGETGGSVDSLDLSSHFIIHAAAAGVAVVGWVDSDHVNFKLDVNGDVST
jgi:hypothetical protein